VLGQRNGKNKHQNSGTRVVPPPTTPMIISELAVKKKLKKIQFIRNGLKQIMERAIKTGLFFEDIHMALKEMSPYHPLPP